MKQKRCIIMHLQILECALKSTFEPKSTFHSLFLHIKSNFFELFHCQSTIKLIKVSNPRIVGSMSKLNFEERKPFKFMFNKLSKKSNEFVVEMKLNEYYLFETDANGIFMSIFNIS